MEAFPHQSKAARTARDLPRAALVTATARLHFGFLDPSGRSAHPFGSFGLSLDRPVTRLALRRSERVTVHGPERERAERYLRKIAASCDVDECYDLKIEEVIPPHAGLGSGTQLALAVGSAFAALEGLSLEPQEIAARLGRGARSGIGIATFALGGTVLDSGPIGGGLPDLVSRVPFPADWRVILIFDEETEGLAGASEIAAFESLPEFPARDAEGLSRRITQGALPALAQSDFPTFCQHVAYLQARMGSYFAPKQGGVYTSPRVADALTWLRNQGIVGIGQSSWGPTGFAFASSLAEGEDLLSRLRTEVNQPGLSFDLAQGRNEGAKIETD
jgi:beta-ribofuranosylaminobenzene 5'-phosphate synthase